MRAFAGLVAVCLFVSAVPAAHGQDEKAKKEAKKLLFQGDALFAKGQWSQALAKYQRAYEVFPSKKIFYALAQTEEKLGQDIEALIHYEEMLAEVGEQLDEDLRTKARVRINEIERRIAILNFDVEPNGATVLVDDIEQGQTPLPKPIRLRPGPHKYVVMKDGFKVEQKQIELKAGARQMVEFEMTPIGQAGKEPKGKGKKPKGEKKVVKDGTKPGGGGGGGEPKSGRAILYTGIAATSVLGASAVVTGILAVSKHGTFTDMSKPEDEREDARKSGKTFALVTDILLVSTIASGAFTAYWYYSVVKPNEAWISGTSTSARPLVSPYVTESGGGITLSGTF